MRKLMMAVTAVAGLAVATGCQRNSGSEVQEQREEVAQAQQNVSETSREAHQELREQTAEARQEAGQEIAEAQENLNEEQRELSEARAEQRQEQAQAATASAAATTVQGSLQSKDDDMLVLTVKEQGNRQLKLKTDDQTRVMQGNREVKLDDIQEGAQVRASYVAEGQDMVARDVTVLPAAANTGNETLER